MDKYIIYDNTPWEKQFIFQDLLNINISTYKKIIYTNNELNYSNISKWKLLDYINISTYKKIIHTNNDLNYSNISKWKSLDNINDIIDNNVLIFNSNRNPYNRILKIVKLLKPVIIIHLSDEWGNKEAFQGLHQFTKLVLRQHHHANYYQKANIQYIPLGYMNGMLELDYMDKQLKLPSKRKYKWSFIGNIKQDRQIMIDKMKLITPYCTDKMDKIQMRETYRESIFVPNGRGNAKLDCFRLYEASICGAIPILVGSKKEIKETFCKEENPPWLIFDTWENAQIGCLELLKDMDKLDKISKENINWWKNRVMKLRERINSYL